MMSRLPKDITSRQMLQGMAHDVSHIRSQLLELGLYDTPLIVSDHFTDAMAMLRKASLEISHLRNVASPDFISKLSEGLSDVDSILNRI